MKKIDRNRLIWAAVLLWLGMLLYLSWQPGEETAETSGRLATLVFNVLSAVGIKLRYETIHTTLRTAAHIVVFFVLGALMKAAVAETPKPKDGQNRKVVGLLFCLLVCAGIAVLSEVVKIYIPGRHLDWPEVGLNIAGACGGCLGMHALQRRKLLRQ